MPAFRVVKKPLCFGTGDPLPEWEYTVEAENEGEILDILRRNGCTTGVKIHRVQGKSLLNFAKFLWKKRSS